jgi:phosphoribosyl 1,2-cyclic phosphate phosphodiesterase
MRASLYVEGAGGERAVIDTGPEFRPQALRAGIRRLDGVFLTHAHADHVHGLDDVRALTWETPLRVYGSRSTLEEVKERFSYAFRETQRGGGKPRLILVEADGPVSLGGLVFTPLPVKHGGLDILGWRIDEAAAPGPAVYFTDISGIPPAAKNMAGRPEVLVIDGLRARPHETHFSFAQALAGAVEMGARRVFLTHICHEHSHEEINEYCRAFMEERGISGISMEAAWDGLAISL